MPPYRYWPAGAPCPHTVLVLFELLRLDTKKISTPPCKDDRDAQDVKICMAPTHDDSCTVNETICMEPHKDNFRTQDERIGMTPMSCNSEEDTAEINMDMHKDDTSKDDNNKCQELQEQIIALEAKLASSGQAFFELAYGQIKQVESNNKEMIDNVHNSIHKHVTELVTEVAKKLSEVCFAGGLRVDAAPEKSCMDPDKDDTVNSTEPTEKLRMDPDKDDTEHTEHTEKNSMDPDKDDTEHHDIPEEEMLELAKLLGDLRGNYVPTAAPCRAGCSGSGSLELKKLDKNYLPADIMIYKKDTTLAQARERPQKAPPTE
jgi:hypothetical protein